MIWPRGASTTEGRPTSGQRTRYLGGDRSRVAMAEVGAAALLYVSFFLPWFVVPRAATRLVPAHTELVAWVTHAANDYAIDSWDMLIPLAALVAMGSALAGLILAGRGKVLGLLFGCGMAGAGVLIQMTTVNAGQELDAGAAVTGVSFGIWVYAAAAILGIGLGILDLALTGYSTFVSRAVGVPSLKGYVAFAAMSVAAMLAVAQIVPAFWVASGILLVGLILAAPGGIARASAVTLSLCLIVALDPALRTPWTIAACLGLGAAVSGLAGFRLWRDRDLPEEE